MCNLAISRCYGTVNAVWALSDASIFFLKKIQEVLSEKLGEEWEKLNDKIDEWRARHKEKQEIYKKEFAI